MQQYHQFLRDILTQGTYRPDRTGTGAISAFGLQMRFDLKNGFPLVTSKKVFTRGIIEELLWMLRGSTNANELIEKGVHIWDAWAREGGDLGPIYGKQMRAWAGADGNTVDQISGLIDGLRKDPYSRRHLVSCWNVADLPDMALAPCHCLFQFFVTPSVEPGRKPRLSCQLYQRSADAFLGVPFNIASYALLTHMVAQQVEMEPGEFIWTGGDCHIYINHINQVKVQLMRPTRKLPKLKLARKQGGGPSVSEPFGDYTYGPVESIFDYRFDDVQIIDYYHEDSLPGDVAV